MQNQQCTSGFCSPQGKCCDQACTNGCQSCAQADTQQPDGTCVNLSGTDPNHTCAGVGTCDGMNKCSCVDGIKNFGETDVDCGGQCPKKCAPGHTCSADSDCENLFHNCADKIGGVGVCCDATCTDPCYSCRLGSPWQGLCTTDFVGDHGACPAGQACNTMQLCMGGMGAANGQTCMHNGECFSGLCSQNGMPGTCLPNQPHGYICTTNNQCTSNSCNTTVNTCN
jgi:hypothetical protein